MKKSTYKKDKLQIKLNSLVKDLKTILNEEEVKWNKAPVVQSAITDKQVEKHQGRIEQHLKGVEEGRKNAVPMPPPINLKNSGKIDTKTRNALVANITKVTQSTDKLNTKYFKANMEVFDEYSMVLQEREVYIDEFILDMTKLVNELKKTKNLADRTDIDSIEEAKKITQYFVKTYQDMANKFIEADKKIAEFKTRYTLFEKQSFEAVDAIKKKYNIDSMNKEIERDLKKIWTQMGMGDSVSGEDFPDWDTFIRTEIADLKEKGIISEDIEYKGSEFYTVVEGNAKEKLREIRPILGKLLDIPEDILKYAKISIQAFGKHFNLTSNAPRLKHDKNIFNYIKETAPDVFADLVEKNLIYFEDTKDSVNIVRPAIAELKNLFMEFDVEVKKLDDQVENDIDVKEKMNENMLKNMTNNIFNTIYTTFYTYINKLNALGDRFLSGFNRQTNKIKSVETNLNKIEDGIRTHNREMYKKLLELKEEKSKLDTEILKQAKEKL
jgi:hypothetical protein